MIKVFSFVLVAILAISCSEKAIDISNVNQNVDEKIINQSELMAMRDVEVDSMKYYFYSIAYPDASLFQKFKTYNITLVPRNCVLDTNETNYNSYISKVLHDKFGISLVTLLKE